MLSTAFTATKSHDREMNSLVSTLKHNQKSEVPAPLMSFLACQIVTLKNAGLSYQKSADELGLKAKSTAHQFINGISETTVICRKNQLVGHQNYRKKPRKNW